jgi:spore germination protein GerM
MTNYIGLLINRTNGQITSAQSLGIRQLIKNTSSNSVWEMANGEYSYGNYAKQHKDGYLYNHKEHTCTWENNIYSITVKYYPTNKPLEMTKSQLERFKIRRQEDLSDSLKSFLKNLSEIITDLNKFTKLINDGIKLDKRITGNELVFLCDFYKVSIPLRTRGYYMNKLCSIIPTKLENNSVNAIKYAAEGKLNLDILYKTLDNLLETINPEVVTAEDQEAFNYLFKKVA